MFRHCLVTFAVTVGLALNAWCEDDPNWYQKSFFLLHEDHHTSGDVPVGQDADIRQVRRLVSLSRPDMIQIHAKGNPGWTTYPSKIGHVPPRLQCDVLDLWRDVAREDGYAWSIYYNIGRDGEIMLRRPEWNRSASDGTEIERALCYHSGVAEAYIWPMLREIMAGYRPDGFWFDGSVFTIRSCYCDACRKRFREATGRQPPTSPDDPLWGRFQEMHREIYREFVRRTCELLHQIDPDCLVTFNWINSLRMPEKPDDGIAYLTGDIANRVEGLSAEAHWYDTTGLPFDLMTTGHTFVADEATGRPKKVPKPAVQIEQEMAVIIANGGRFNLWDTPSPTSGIDPALHTMYGRVVRPFLRSRQPFCQGTRRVPDVSLLHSAAGHYAYCDAGPLPFGRRNNRIDGAANVLPRLHLNYETLGDWRLHDQEVGAGLLVVEHPKRLSERDVDGILRFLQDGGDVLLTGMGISQGKGRLLAASGLESVRSPEKPDRYSVAIGQNAYRFDHFVYDVTPGQAEVLLEATSPEGAARPLLTSCGCGRGTAYYLSFPLLSAHGPQKVPLAMVDDLFRMVLPDEQRRVVTDLPETVEVVLRTDGRRHLLHLVNMAEGRRTAGPRVRYVPVSIHALPTAPPCQVSVRLPKRPTAVLAQPGERSLEFTYEDGRVRLETPAVEVHSVIEFRP